jgi:hemerythrin-like domain-containing protein
MKNRIARWQMEHANFTRLLHLVDAQIALLERGERPDYELMLDVMHYMTHYPDRHHHPHEDIACQVLLERDPDARAWVDDLAGQHRRIAKSGEQLVRDLNAIVDGALISRSAVEADARAYTQTLRDHMAREEKHVFPALERALSAEDWTGIDGRIERTPDPVFGGSVDPRYSALQRRIVEQVGCECSPVG